MKRLKRLFHLLLSSPALDRELLAAKDNVRRLLAAVTPKLDTLNAAVAAHLTKRNSE